MGCLENLLQVTVRVVRTVIALELFKDAERVLARFAWTERLAFPPWGNPAAGQP
jgi:hypothetical protein